MKVVLSRVDERLLHGQVLASWTRILQVEKILVIDDKIANDTFMVEVLKMSAPTGVSAEVLTCEDAYNQLSSSNDETRTMLLFKNVDMPQKLVKLGYDLKKLDIGNMGSGPTRKPITKRVFMSDDEVGIVKDLVNSGINVYLQMLSSDSVVDIKSILK